MTRTDALITGLLAGTALAGAAGLFAQSWLARPDGSHPSQIEVEHHRHRASEADAALADALRELSRSREECRNLRVLLDTARRTATQPSDLDPAERIPAPAVPYPTRP